MEQQLANIPSESAFSLQSFEHVQRVANMLSASDLIPKEYRNNIPNTMIALEMANRISTSPLMVMQNLYVVNGKPGWSSQFIIASINSCGRFRKLRFDMLNDGAARGCVAWTVEKHIPISDTIITLKQAKESGIPVIESPYVDMAMAKAEGWIDKSGSKWKTMPDLMLRYRAATFFGRIHTPEIMMGMQTQEEILDIPHEEVELISEQNVKDLFNEKRALLSDDELANATRIIEGKEVNSYKKLNNILNSK